MLSSSEPLQTTTEQVCISIGACINSGRWLPCEEQEISAIGLPPRGSLSSLNVALSRPAFALYEPHFSFDDTRVAFALETNRGNWPGRTQYGVEKVRRTRLSGTQAR